LLYPYSWVPTPDVDNNGVVNILDMLAVAVAFGGQPGDSNWDAIADLDQNVIINVLDILVVAIHFGETR
jgi:hypothetical protein